jgi:hypothetical protein
MVAVAQSNNYARVTLERSVQTRRSRRPNGIRGPSSLSWSPTFSDIVGLVRTFPTERFNQTLEAMTYLKRRTNLKRQHISSSFGIDSPVDAGNTM